MALDVRPAAEAEAGVVIDILAEATAWLRTRGITQWPDRFPSDLIESTIRDGQLFVGVAADEPVATITLAWSDPMFWGDRDDAGFIHRLAVRRSHAGEGAGLIAWADRQTAAAGRAYLCLDTLSHNTALRSYYEGLGFRAVGTVRGPAEHAHSVAHAPGRPSSTSALSGSRRHPDREVLDAVQEVGPQPVHRPGHLHAPVAAHKGL